MDTLFNLVTIKYGNILIVISHKKTRGPLHEIDNTPTNVSVCSHYFDKLRTPVDISSVSLRFHHGYRSHQIFHYIVIDCWGADLNERLQRVPY